MKPEIKNLFEQINKIILGKEQQIKLALTCVLANGHLLIEDIPGTGKTTLAKAIATSLGLDFSRIQCTNDMLPGDILGVSIFDQSENTFSFHQGPVFSQVLLTDEINRATPKTQSALLEAMEENQVSIDGNTFALSEPFFVIATQNPQEQSGTYSLPESQLDRFLMKISLGYPASEFEVKMLKQGGSGDLIKELPEVLTSAQVLELQKNAAAVHVSDLLFEYIEKILRHSRESDSFQTGLSPRAGLSLLRAAKSYAFIEGRDHLLPEDIQAVLPYVATIRLNKRANGNQFTPAELEQDFQQVALPL